MFRGVRKLTQDILAARAKVFAAVQPGVSAEDLAGVHGHLLAYITLKFECVDEVPYLVWQVPDVKFSAGMSVSRRADV